ncbi:hypothetical protein C8J57DRAFT_1238108 [Mycena rebaudengoi]|nr:hypothetical protein C8J57DRAFT_1238108 [Mycena rebaudengoi]
MLAPTRSRVANRHGAKASSVRVSMTERRTVRTRAAHPRRVVRVQPAAPAEERATGSVVPGGVVVAKRVRRRRGLMRRVDGYVRWGSFSRGRYAFCWWCMSAARCAAGAGFAERVRQEQG